jgi:hypothetical protein
MGSCLVLSAAVGEPRCTEGRFTIERATTCTDSVAGLLEAIAWTGAGAESLGGFNGAWGLKNDSKT